MGGVGHAEDNCGQGTVVVPRAEHQARAEAGAGWAKAVPEAGAMVPGRGGAQSTAEPHGASRSLTVLTLMESTGPVRYMA